MVGGGGGGGGGVTVVVVLTRPVLAVGVGAKGCCG